MIVFVLLIFSTNVAAQQNCNPKIWSHKYPLYIYKEQTIQLKLYHCRYQESRRYGDGKPDILKRYDDFTDNCLNASKTGHFMDIYGFLYENLKANVTFFKSFDDSNYGYFKNISITISELTVEADLTVDAVYTPTGEICRYTRGYCHDRKKNADFVWVVVEKSQLKCPNLRRYEAENGAFFLLMKHRYFVSEVNKKFALFEMEDDHDPSSTYGDYEQYHELCDTKVWKTKSYGTYISSANFSSLEAAGHLKEKEYQAYFDVKDDMYDFLVKRCEDRSSDTLEDYTKKVNIARLKMEQICLDEDAKSLDILILGREMQVLRDRLVIILVLCAICGGVCVFYLLYRVVKNLVNNLKERGDIRVAGGTENDTCYGNQYEYVTSNYDVNSLYFK